jgi:hypothetical protein
MLLDLLLKLSSDCQAVSNSEDSSHVVKSLLLPSFLEKLADYAFLIKGMISVCKKFEATFE